MEIVGIPKERMPGERRVSLTPGGVARLLRSGIRVLVEKGAGVLAGYPDEAYEKTGALLVSTPHRLWKGATLIQKVKEPQKQEYSYLQAKHILFSFLHLASPEHCDLVHRLLSSGATAIAYETVEKGGEAILLKPMSEIAGILAAYFAGILRHLVEVKEGAIHFHSWYPKVLERAVREFPKVLTGSDPGRVLILGGGHAGAKAAEMASLMGGKVTLTEAKKERREHLVRLFMEKKLPVNVISSEEDLGKYLNEAAVWVGTVHAAGKRSPLIVNESMLQEASRAGRRIIIDVAVDQGGNVHDSRATTFENPVYLDSLGNLRFGVTNMPSLVARHATLELEKATLDYAVALAEDIDAAIRRYPELKTGINIYRGKLIHEAVAVAHKLAVAQGGSQE